MKTAVTTFCWSLHWQRIHCAFRRKWTIYLDDQFQESVKPGLSTMTEKCNATSLVVHV